MRHEQGLPSLGANRETSDLQTDHVLIDDGVELDVSPDDGYVVGPGHAAWVVGDEPRVTIDFIPLSTP